MRLRCITCLLYELLQAHKRIVSESYDTCPSIGGLDHSTEEACISSPGENGNSEVQRGLGFQDWELFNDSMLAKEPSRLLSNLDSFFPMFFEGGTTHMVISRCRVSEQCVGYVEGYYSRKESAEARPDTSIGRRDDNRDLAGSMDRYYNHNEVYR